MENPTKMDDLGWFGGTPIFGNIQMFIYRFPTEYMTISLKGMRVP